MKHIVYERGFVGVVLMSQYQIVCWINLPSKML